MIKLSARTDLSVVARNTRLKRVCLKFNKAFEVQTVHSAEIQTELNKTNITIKDLTTEKPI